MVHLFCQLYSSSSVPSTESSFLLSVFFYNVFKSYSDFGIQPFFNSIFMTHYATVIYVCCICFYNLFKRPRHEIFQGVVSCPLLDCMYGEYWFRLSRLSIMVIGSFTSYTKTKSVESAVWCLLTRDDDVENRYFLYNGSKYLNTVQDQNCIFEQR